MSDIVRHSDLLSTLDDLVTVTPVELVFFSRTESKKTSGYIPSSRGSGSKAGKN